MRIVAPASIVLTLAVLAGCSAPNADGFSVGDPAACDGVTVVVNFGILSEDRETTCVDFDAASAPGKDVLDFAGFTTEGTTTYGDQIVCRVNGLPSDTEPFVVEGEEPYVESCADMPPGFGYWALWVTSPGSDEWAYAEEGIGTLAVEPGSSLGLVFSTGGETPTPTDP